MKRIFVNGLSSKVGGGKSILTNYLSLLQTRAFNDKYLVLTPDKKSYEKFALESIELIDLHRFLKSTVAAPLVNRFVLPQLIEQLGCDAVFNLADLVIPTDVPQVYLFDWSYAVYPDSNVWKRMDISSWMQRKVKLAILKKYFPYADIVIAQTETMKERLQRIYGLKNLVVVPNAVSLDNSGGGKSFDFNLPKEKYRCLYLTYYYTHKNLEIFIPLAKKIKTAGCPYCLVITISPAQHKRAKRFLDLVTKERLEDTIINVGPVEMARVPSLYAQTDVLLMPTLLESFSGTYVEAMFHGKPILTSDLDFARDVCGEAAYYFDPLNPDSILDAVNLAFRNTELREQKIASGKMSLNDMPTWPQAFEMYQALIEQAAGGS